MILDTDLQKADTVTLLAWLRVRLVPIIPIL